jgi:hypothetical protein
MTFAEFVRQAEEIAQPTAKGTENGGHSICCEVEIWTHPHGKRKLQWDVWSSKMNEHYTGDSGETVIMLLREAFGVADIAEGLEAVGDPAADDAMREVLTNQDVDDG